MHPKHIILKTKSAQQRIDEALAMIAAKLKFPLVNAQHHYREEIGILYRLEAIATNIETVAELMQQSATMQQVDSQPAVAEEAAPVVEVKRRGRPAKAE
jgi:hypothetical protein